MNVINNWLKMISSQPIFCFLQPICWSNVVGLSSFGKFMQGKCPVILPDVADDILSWLEEFGTDPSQL